MRARARALAVAAHRMSMRRCRGSSRTSHGAGSGSARRSAASKTAWWQANVHVRVRCNTMLQHVVVRQPANVVVWHQERSKRPMHVAVLPGPACMRLIGFRTL